MSLYVGGGGGGDNVLLCEGKLVYCVFIFWEWGGVGSVFC